MVLDWPVWAGSELPLVKPIKGSGILGTRNKKKGGNSQARDVRHDDKLEAGHHREVG